VIRLGVLLGVLLLAACGTAPAARLGSPAPDFTLQTVDGTPLRLSDLKGKPVFMNFWATWCVPCREEMPAMQALYEQYRDRGLVILAVNMEEDEARVRRWVDQGGFTYTFVLDSEGQQLKRYNFSTARASSSSATTSTPRQPATSSAATASSATSSSAPSAALRWRPKSRSYSPGASAGSL
jgi:peroxiredoxin